jgi:O-antigen ligase
MIGPLLEREHEAQLISRSAAVVFLTLVLALGGASRGAFLAHGIIDLAAAGLLIWLIWDRQTSALPKGGVVPLALAIGFLAIGLLQLVPLPPAIWTALPGRAEIAKGFELIGAPLPALPISLVPEMTRDALPGLLAPLAAFLLAATTPLRRFGRDLAWAVPAIAAASVVLAIGQVAGGQNSPLYLYDTLDRRVASGLFSNVNHQATLMLVALPFLAAHASQARLKFATNTPDLGLALLVAALGGMIALGAVLAGSTAGYLLLGPVLGLSAIMILGLGLKSLLDWRVLFGLAAIGVVGWVVGSGPILASLAATDAGGASMGRPTLYQNTIEAGLAFAPFGSGLGSFPQIYPRFEDPASVSYVVAPHAHNDYLEIAMELGAPGLLLMAIGLGWFVTTSLQIWRMEPGTETRLRMAASIGLLAILAHSLVDFPLRTPAIATLAGLCAGLMIAPAAGEHRRRRSSRDGMQHKHIEI